MHWVFETLGIEAGADAGTIRRAYARAIKQCDQAIEAQRFQRIREAYEMAMQWAIQESLVKPEWPGPADAAPKRDKPSMDTSLTPDGIAQRVKPALDGNDLWNEFLAAYSQAGADDVPHLLNSYAPDHRLTALDAKADFECSLLALAFTAPVNITLLDAASDLFSWEISHRHLFEARPDLASRLQRQQLLRSQLTHRRGLDMKDFMEAVRLHAARDIPHGQPQPWKITYINDALDRYGLFKHEVAERFGADTIDWWRSLSRREAESKTHTQQTVHLGSQPYIEWVSKRSPAKPIMAPAGKRAQEAASASDAAGHRSDNGMLSALRLFAALLRIVFVIVFVVFGGMVVIALLIKLAVKVEGHGI